MGHPYRVWVVDDDRSIRWVLQKALAKADMDVRVFNTADHALGALGREEPSVIITDIRMPGTQGLELLDRVNTEYPDLPVIIMTAHSDLDHAVSAYQHGAFDYLPKPFDIGEAVDLVRRACKSRSGEFEAETQAEQQAPTIIGEAPSMQEVFRAIGRLSRSNITVLITGESGTGKELVAQALHRHSPRASKPFIALNTAAIPRDLLESELFGHEKGAFTGAQGLRRGRFEQADGGTLFLDEIGDMPAELQTRLLRVLANSEFYRVGGHVPIRGNVRIIAATHQDLEARVSQGLFREDLLHRLNVIRIHVPALRDRRMDIPELLRFFLSRAAAELHEEPKTPSPEVVDILSRLPWPGNVRQLQNTCRWLTVMAAGSDVHLEDLPPELRSSCPDSPGGWQESMARWANDRLEAGEGDIATRAIRDAERVLIESALEHTGGRRQDAARLLGWGRNTLTRKIKELNLNDNASSDHTDSEEKTETA